MRSLDEILAGVDAGLIVLAETSAEGFQDLNPGVVRRVTEAGYNAVIITINNPSPILKKVYEKSGIDTERVYYIDAITRYALGTLPDSDDPNTCYVSQPGNLTDIGIELNKSLAALNGKKVCVIIDSINTMLIYVPTETLVKFIHFVSNKLRLLQCLGIYLSTGGSIDPMLSSQLRSFSDVFIEVKKEDKP